MHQQGFRLKSVEESEHLMSSDHERLHELVVEQERHDAQQRESCAADSADTGQTAPHPTFDSSPMTDSEQAQTNLERMLETGEENPIS